MEKNRTVLVPFGRGDVEVRHIPAVQRAFFFLHLQPLLIVAMARMDLAKRFHCQEKNELEMRHATGQGPAFQRGNKAFARSHDWYVGTAGLSRHEFPDHIHGAGGVGRKPVGANFSGELAGDRGAANDDFHARQAGGFDRGNRGLHRGHGGGE